MEQMGGDRFAVDRKLAAGAGGGPAGGRALPCCEGWGWARRADRETATGALAESRGRGDGCDSGG